MTDEVLPDVAERRYERWVMRAAELVWGDYPDDRKGAERVLPGEDAKRFGRQRAAARLLRRGREHARRGQ